MKKIVSAVLALIMVCSLACTVLAAEDTFVPSIGAKPAPEVMLAELVEDGQVIAEVSLDHLLITPVAEAEKEPRLPVVAKDLLLFVYNALNDDSMELPADKLQAAGLIPSEAVVRDLVDMSWICEETSPTHAEMLEKEGVVLRVTFAMKGLDEGETIAVMSYKNEKWDNIEKVVNNGNGTVTCTFEHLCPVAFVVGPDGVPPTGVQFSVELMFWTFALVASAATLVVVVVKRRKNA